MSVESLLSRLRAGTPATGGDSGTAPVTPVTSTKSQTLQRDAYGEADCTSVTFVTLQNISRVIKNQRPERINLQSALHHRTHSIGGVTDVTDVQPYGEAGCSRNAEKTTGVTGVTTSTRNTNEAAISRCWLVAVAAHLDTTPAALLAAGVILLEEVMDYIDHDPQAMADALRLAHPGRWPKYEPDDRRHCRTCQHLSGSRCRATRLLIMDDLPRRCSDYRPLPDDPDQRNGRERWPSLEAD